MAITKIHPIKVNLKKALDYIENPDKTDDKMFVSSYGCSYETADIEFQMLLDQAFKKGNNLAHHLIQAFEPGETTPEQAHEIGRQLADEVLGGKYPYVITTHIDKGHLHNHIIFCAVDMANQRKYISNKQSYAYIRRTSDRLCRENGLSVVKPGKDKGKSYAEWDAQRKGKSWKAKLKIAIDAAIPQARDFDGLLRLMEAQGYEMKRGKFISFRAPGQERFTRCKTLGEDYTEEAITRRIKGLAVDRGPKRKAEKGISLRIEIENNIKDQQSAGYARWAKVHNLKQAAKALNFLTEHQIESYEGLESRLNEISAANDEAAAALKAVERRLGDMALLIKHISTYKQLRPVALELRQAKDKAVFRREHESQLILYEAAAKALKEAGVKKLPNLYALKTEYKKLDGERERLSEQYNEVKKELKEYGIIKQNVDGILRVTPGKEHTQER
ncbi:relaxase/mobilization nuclease domain-containing protein [Clostridioides difficile]|nr:relaxase/mobilization nuclease domain-containing protein [Clostridioides difficile]